MKTLVAILDYNFPEITDPLYESFVEHQDATHDIIVIDNHSDADKRSQYASVVAEENGYFGGGLNLAFRVLTERPEYDSLLFVTNDLIIDTWPLVPPMREAMFTGGYHWVGASVNEPPHGTHWKQCRPHGATTPRELLWFDLPCTLFRRELVDAIGQYDDLMKYGWGQDIYTGMVVEHYGWKAAMLDTVQVTHKGHNNTMSNGRGSISVSEYTTKCLHGMETFFSATPERYTTYLEYRFWADRYTYHGT